MSDWEMTPNQMQWLEDLIEEHRIAASNERLWALGSDDAEIAEMHLTNSIEHAELADEFCKLLDECRHKEN